MKGRYIMKLLKGNRITIPKEVVEALELEEFAVLTVEGNKIILQPAKVEVK